MKISGSGPIQAKSIDSKKRSRTGDASGFADAVGDTQASEAVGSVHSASPLASIEGLLGLQDVGSSTDGRSKGLARANDMLDMLEGIRRGILLGALSSTDLRRLADMARNGRDKGADPRLDAVLEEIELRAEVELAKYGF